MTKYLYDHYTGEYMTVDELIVALQKVSNMGYGNKEVTHYEQVGFDSIAIEEEFCSQETIIVLY